MKVNEIDHRTIKVEASKKGITIKQFVTDLISLYFKTIKEVGL